MSTPYGTDQAHRRGGIWSRVKLAEGRGIDDQAWRDAIAGLQNVGVCGPCGSKLQPCAPDTTNRHRTAYPATCIGCGHEVIAYGPPPVKTTPDPPPAKARTRTRT